jgi:hypothetical protein
VVTIVGEEWSLAGGSVDGVVVGEFGEWKELLPVVLLIVAEDTQILLKYLVDTLSLAVSLRVERR